MNILVTGGASYVDAVLIPKLFEAGHVVTCYGSAEFFTFDTRLDE